MLAAGYLEIGLDHFALPHDALAGAFARGTLHRNFMGYTDRRTTALLGLGVSAISETPACYHQNEKVITVYERRVGEGEVPTLRGHVLSDDDRKRADVIRALMTTGRAPLTPPEAEAARVELVDLVRDGIVEIDDRQLRITDQRQAVHPQRRGVLRRLPAYRREGRTGLLARDMRPAQVIGAGISGLAAAWHLADRGFAVTVVDRSPGPGGLINTIADALTAPSRPRRTRFVWDEVVSAWFRRLDLTPVFPEPASKRRYIFRNGRPRRWPLGAGESLAMAGRLAAAALTRSTPARDDETIAAWGDRVLGASAREWLLEPAMQGIYASPARELSARAIFDGRKRGPATTRGARRRDGRVHLAPARAAGRSRRSILVQRGHRSSRSLRSPR